RMHARRLGDRAEDRHRAVGKEAVAVATDRARDLLPNQVVRKEEVLAFPASVGDGEDVFTVRRAHHPLEPQGRRGIIEDLVVAALEEVPTREHDAVIFGELVARLPDGIDANDAFAPRVEDEIAVGWLTERLDPQENELPDLRVCDVTVVERLIRI